MNRFYQIGRCYSKWENGKDNSIYFIGFMIKFHNRKIKNIFIPK